VGATGTAAAVEVAGHGLLRDTLARRLAQGSLDHAGTVDAAAVVVLATDGCDLEQQDRFDAECRSRGAAWLPVHVEAGEVVVGPWTLPGHAGCLVCARTRRSAAARHPEELAGLHDRWAQQPLATEVSWLTTCAAELVAEIVSAELRLVGHEPGQARAHRAVICLELSALTVAVHPFLPDPCCPACGALPEDTAASARIELRPAPKADPKGYRVRRLDAAVDRDRLRARYVEDRLGLTPHLTRRADSMFAVARATVGQRGAAHRASGSGRTLSYLSAEVCAVAEALERYGGLSPNGRRGAVRASMRELGEAALDPARLGLHSPAQYDLPGYRYQRYHRDLTLSWVWGYSFGRQRPLLVPQSLAYYGTPAPGSGERRFVSDTSNGCALGGCLEEAILHGLLEVAERDAFLLTWYGRLTVPRVEVRSLQGSTAALLVERIEHTTGHTVHVFDTTQEQGVPAVWVMAVDEQDRADTPKAVCGAGAHLDPHAALDGALLELGRQLEFACRTYPAEREHTLPMLDDPRLVRVMADHAPLYHLPEAFGRLSFLHDTPLRTSFAEAFGGAGGRPPASDDLSVDLRATIDRYLDTGLDVLVVDQTGPEHAVEGFACAKVLVPGALPMVFGYDHRRVHGFDRLDRLGVEPNPHPHPFP